MIPISLEIRLIVYIPLAIDITFIFVAVWRSARSRIPLFNRPFFQLISHWTSSSKESACILCNTCTVAVNSFWLKWMQLTQKGFGMCVFLLLVCNRRKLFNFIQMSAFQIAVLMTFFNYRQHIEESPARFASSATSHKSDIDHNQTLSFLHTHRAHTDFVWNFETSFFFSKGLK